MLTPVIAVDVMGGDFGPSCTVPACLSFLKQNPKVNIILVGDSTSIASCLPKNSSLSSRYSILHTSEVVEMGDSIAVALRSKPNSSMKMALELVQSGKANACVSAGNTGALMALARNILKTVPGINRPAIMCALPTQHRKKCYLLDLGANIDCSAQQLYEFAIMGSVAAEVLGITSPKVALLNVGIEDIKGNQQVKQTAELLESQTHINYIGYVEGDGIYRGDADVVVCDGFVGNVFLKASEGVLKLLSHRLQRYFKRSWLGGLNRLWMFLPILNRLRKEFSPEYYNGASLLGLQGVVVKSHGAANTRAFEEAINHALVEVEGEIPQRLSVCVSALLRE